MKDSSLHFKLYLFCLSASPAEGRRQSESYSHRGTPASLSSVGSSELKLKNGIPKIADVLFVLINTQ